MVVQVQHPAAKMLVLAATMQEKECGDATNLVSGTRLGVQFVFVIVHSPVAVFIFQEACSRCFAEAAPFPYAQFICSMDMMYV